MNDFHDVRFPLHLAFGASGGPVRPTEILRLANGTEVRNARGQHSRRQYNAVAGLKSKSQVVELLQFYESRFGALFGFRFRDPLDNASGAPVSPMDQHLGYGDGEQTEFQLRKAYGTDPYIYYRPITKPVEESVRVAIDGVEVAADINSASGIIRLSSPPDLGANITAGFEFDVPVRFASEALDIVLDDFGAAQIQNIPLIEILPILETSRD